VEVTKKPTQTPYIKKWGRAETTRKDNASEKRPRKERTKVPNNLILGNHEASKEMKEIFINSTSSREVYDRSTTIANLCFSTVIAENFINNPHPKTMAVCKKRSDWNKWKEAIEAKLISLKK
jgi:hypothetical protein